MVSVGLVYCICSSNNTGLSDRWLCHYISYVCLSLGFSCPRSQLSLNFSREKQQWMFINSLACMGSNADWRQTPPLFFYHKSFLFSKNRNIKLMEPTSFLRLFLFWFLPLGTERILINILLLIIHHYKHGTFSVFTTDLSLSSVLHMLLPLLGISSLLLCWTYMHLKYQSNSVFFNSVNIYGLSFMCRRRFWALGSRDE